MCVRGTVSKLRVDVHYAVLKISLLFVRVAIILGSQSSVLLKYITLLRNALYKSPHLRNNVLYSIIHLMQ